jgi:hypothetical protein
MMLNVTMKMKIVRMKLFESILSKHQDEELEGEEIDEDDTSELERVTTQDAGYDDTSCRKAVHCLH